VQILQQTYDRQTKDKLNLKIVFKNRAPALQFMHFIYSGFLLFLFLNKFVSYEPVSFIIFVHLIPRKFDN